MEGTFVNTINFDSNYKITVDEMWKITKNDIDNDIEGYEIAKVYFDHIKSKNNKKIWEKNTSKNVKSDWPPRALRDETGQVKWPKRKNYLDDVIYKLKIIK